MRPISNVVDVTNYVMHALGNPLHAFDFDSALAAGASSSGARGPARSSRRSTATCAGSTPRDLVIADAEGAIAFAGIMGGLDTEVRDETTNVLLEAANFEPGTILWSSERHALRTEGSNRWEKGVDPYLAPQAAALATELIVELTGARWTGDVDVHGELPERPVVRFRPERANRLARPRDPGAGAEGGARAARLRGRARLEGDRPDLAGPRRRRARWTSSRRSRACTGSRRSPSRCRCAAPWWGG